MKSHHTIGYAGTIAALLMHPRDFFMTRFNGIGLVQALLILSFSSLFFAVTGALMQPGAASLAVGIIHFVNAVGMVALGTAIGWVALLITTGRRYRLAKVFTVFSLSSGAVLLIAWVPSAFFLTEPWKWWLIGTGMVHGMGLTKTSAAIAVLMTFGALVAMIYALLPWVQQLSLHGI